jgi:hypothetical protein
MNPSIDPVQQFFSMWAQANTAIWPMQLVFYVGAVVSIAIAIKQVPNASRLIAGFLAAYYVWMGIVFFGIYYSPINDHAMVDGVMFLLGAVLFLLAGLIRQDLQFQPKWDLLGVTGGAFILYALLIYPMIGMLTGRFFPAAPLFGLAPCPSTIFTAGLLLWSRPRMPMYVLVVPLVWLLAMTPADAVAMDVIGDVARPIVGVVATALLVWREYRALRERLIAFALLFVAVLCLGHDELLMLLGLTFLVVTFVHWLFIQRHGPFGAGLSHEPGHAAAPAK